MPRNAQTSVSARRRQLSHSITYFPSFAIFCAFVPCKFFSWLAINFTYTGLPRFRAAITGQGFLSAHFCGVVHANRFMPTSLAKLLSHIMRSSRRFVLFLRPSVVPARTGPLAWSDEMQIATQQYYWGRYVQLRNVAHHCKGTYDRQHTGSLSITARLLVLVILHLQPWVFCCLLLAPWMQKRKHTQLIN